MKAIVLLSEGAVPLLLALIGLSMLLSRKQTSEDFLLGAREGMRSCVGLVPNLVLLLVGVSMFTASGAAELLAGALAPLLTPLGVESELVGFLLVRPFSGAASTAMAAELLSRLGADSTAGVALSLILATSDTAVYVISVYMAAAGVKKTRHAFPCAILAMLFGILFCSAVARFFFG